MRLLVVGVAVMLLLGACGSDSEGPPDIAYGRDLCDQCGMIIDDPRFASAYEATDNTVHRFDDIGGMLTFAHLMGDLGTMTAWVHDFETEMWIDAGSALYARGGISTPMEYGVVAFSSQAGLERYVDQTGAETIDWDGLLNLVRSGQLRDTDQHNMEDGQ